MYMESHSVVISYLKMSEADMSCMLYKPKSDRVVICISHQIQSDTFERKVNNRNNQMTLKVHATVSA